MKSKLRAVSMFLAVSFLVPLGEVVIRGHSEPFGPYGLIYAVLGAFAIYWWYYLDKLERGFRAGAVQNTSVAVLSFIGLPIYFFRSRGFWRGAVATLVAFAILIFANVLTLPAEYAGKGIAF